MLKSLNPHCTHHRDRETDSDHDDMVQDHEELSAQIAADGWTHRFGFALLVIFDLKFVPVAQEHGIDVIEEVGDSKEDIAAGKPMPGQREEKDEERKNKSEKPWDEI